MKTVPQKTYRIMENYCNILLDIGENKMINIDRNFVIFKIK